MNVVQRSLVASIIDRLVQISIGFDPILYGRKSFKRRKSSSTVFV